MLTTILLAVGLVGAAMLGMAVGVIFSNRRLRGSCGGVGDECACEATGDPNACAQPSDAA
ncbi:MAG: hypothetical protein KC420_06415 [Myxococcales bacterium]|nr:hypothetical protein [Myxococcales bacterium]MCB9567597.1 hypothetical protein [Myxococcales bacterium]MCB9702588.1 hypothetical protein [Myxococcales bacterium]